MADESGQSWREIRRELPVNEAQVAMYERLMEAERLLDGVRRRRGLDAGAFEQALAAAQAGAADGEDVYLAALAGYVSQLGGRIDVSAVFDDEIVRLPHSS